MRLSIIFVYVFFIAILLIPATGCYNDKEELLYPGSGAVSCTGVSAKFSTEVKPIMQNKCATDGCHNGAAAAGGVILETHTQIAAKAVRINQRCVVEKTMPPIGPLLPAETAALKCWIASGAPNN